jgi:DNA-binding GntR family transcriptional regulator
MREQKNVGVATKDHDRIVAALRAGDLTAACAALKQNMQSGREPIVAWLKTRAVTKGK